jgi:non-ribosomal peptide synthase protein (TIGR01720 family)
VKEEARWAPRRGLGYGLLRYLSGPLEGSGAERPSPGGEAGGRLAPTDGAARAPASGRARGAAGGLAGSASAEVSFNYLGQMDRGLGEGGEFAPAGEGRGPERSPRGRRSYLVDVTGIVLGGRLRLEWSYSRSAHRRETIEAVAGWFADALRALVEQRGSADAGSYAPSDFALARLDQRTLERILQRSVVEEPIE